jgi:hypothetical protein
MVEPEMGRKGRHAMVEPEMGRSGRHRNARIYRDPRTRPRPARSCPDALPSLDLHLWIVGRDGYHQRNLRVPGQRKVLTQAPVPRRSSGPSSMTGSEPKLYRDKKR